MMEEDLNVSDRDDRTTLWDDQEELGDSPEPSNEESANLSMPDNEQSVAACREVDSANLTLQQMESRLAIGEVLKDEATAYALYCKYASLKGFKVRIGRNIKSKDATWVIGKYYFCSCEGFPDNKASKNKFPEYRKTSSRCGCQARLRIGRRKGQEEWRVSKFDAEHNHDMFAPDQTYLLKSTRYISEDHVVMLNTMVKSRIPEGKAIDYLEKLSGGRQNVGHIPADADEAICGSSRKERIDNGDSIELVQYFMKKRNKESNFYWNFELDSDKHLRSFFFRDSQCQVDYECFGDVLSLDTTYRMNKYDYICVPFVGINHHNDNILFGIGFLSDATEVSFEWLFSTFLESMGGKQPAIIFTYQCQSIMNGAEKVFLWSHHRLCQWHVNQNSSSHFGSLSCDASFMILWAKCLNDCESEEEFEMIWKEMMENYNITDIQRNWFGMMYNLRHKWAVVFSRNIFSANLLATSRIEEAKSALERCMGNANSSLVTCVNGYEEIQENWRLKEKEKDNLCQHNMPGVMVENNPLLQQAASVYTPTIFNLFQQEFRDTATVVLLSESSNHGGSSLRQFEFGSHGKNSDIRTVVYDWKKLEIRCSCHKFETSGVLCKHALKVMDLVKLHYIPDKYILNRWSKCAKNRLVNGVGGPSNVSDHSGGIPVEMEFVNQTTKRWNEIAMQCKAHEEARKVLIECIDNAQVRVNAVFQNMKLAYKDGCCEHPTEKDDNLMAKVLVCDPLFAKSREAANRLKRRLENKRKKGEGPTDYLSLPKVSCHREGFRSASVLNVQPLYWKVTNPTLSPSHLQELPGFTRSVYKRDHALITPETHDISPLPQWTNTLGAYLITPAMGSHFVMYLAKMQENSKSGSPPNDVERFVFVLQGVVDLCDASGVGHKLEVNSYAYLPPNSYDWLHSDASATLVVFERRYAYLEHQTTEKIIGSTDKQPPLETTGEVFELRKLLPTSLPYDFNIHIMDFQPGEFLNVKEVHHNQHGLLLLEGQGIHRLGDNWYPVQSGDAIWMGPYVPQWYGALGKNKSRYLLYKEVNRNPL